jgi:hypothetical protein
MAQVLSDKQVYRKIKQDVMMKEAKDYYATPDPRVQRVGYPSQKEAPSVLLLKRKAIRVFPDGQKVALYYAQAIDKYVSIPYNEIGINEQVELEENVVGAVIKGVATVGKAAISKGKAALDAYKAKRAANAASKAASKNKNRPKGGKGKGGKARAAAAGAAAGAAAAGGSGSSSSSSTNEPKYFTPMSSKIQANVSANKREGGSDSRAERERQASLRASKSMANESVNLDGNVFELNNTTAQKVTALYESLNKKNKKKMIEMMNESSDNLQKIISFAVRQ